MKHWTAPAGRECEPGPRIRDCTGFRLIAQYATRYIAVPIGQSPSMAGSSHAGWHESRGRRRSADERLLALLPSVISGLRGWRCSEMSF